MAVIVGRNVCVAYVDGVYYYLNRALEVTVK
jgi:hypothetical protein